MSFKPHGGWFRFSLRTMLPPVLKQAKKYQGAGLGLTPGMPPASARVAIAQSPRVPQRLGLFTRLAASAGETHFGYASRSLASQELAA
jgi:hypothetical protein